MTTSHAALIAALNLSLEEGDIDELAQILRELLRRGLGVEARQLAVHLIEDEEEDWTVEDAGGETLPVYRDDDDGEEALSLAQPLWLKVAGVRVPLVWGPRRAQLFAVEGARRVLPIFEDVHWEATRLEAALEVATRSAYGLATKEERQAAAQQVSSLMSIVGMTTPAGEVVWAVWMALREDADEVASVVAEAARDAHAKWEAGEGESEGRSAAGREFLADVVDPLFLRWSLGEVPEYTA